MLSYPNEKVMCRGESAACGQVIRWAIGLDLHRDFLRDRAGRVAITAEGIDALADSLLATDRR